MSERGETAAMRSIALKVAYDGTAFSGFAKQRDEGVRTVQRILAEGVSDGEERRVIPLDQDAELPYAVVESGIHLIQLI